MQDSAQVTASNYSFNLAVNGSSSSTSDGFWTGLGNVVNQSISTEISNGIGQAIASGTTYESMAITMTIGGSGTDFYLTLVDSEGTISELTGGNKSGWKYRDFDLEQILYTDKVSYLVLDNTVLGASDAFEANQAAIAASVPEPATASLSLLGLAALMMRRRRA